MSKRSTTHATSHAPGHGTGRAAIAAALLAASMLVQPVVHARSALDEQALTRSVSQPVDLVIALDVSGSMSGLIESTKQRLWDVVNELGQARPQPDLRVAVLSYGNPGYGQQSGFVRVDVPLTRDLDAVNEALFGFTTSGGKEYVARVIGRATDALDWSPDERALRIMFVAGNESATQDPLVSIAEATRAARARGIVVNTVYCANDARDQVAAGWRQVAHGAGGRYASIDQNAATVANVTTPYDVRLRELNAALNRTYVPYGEEGGRRQENQVRQDRNAALMSAPAAASRAVTKAGESYRGASWDLVDARESGVALESIESDALPEEMQAMSAKEREQHVEGKASERAAVRDEIKKLAQARREFMQREAETRATAGSAGLDEALKDGLRSAAERKGFRFE